MGHSTLVMLFNPTCAFSGAINRARAMGRTVDGAVVERPQGRNTEVIS